MASNGNAYENIFLGFSFYQARERDRYYPWFSVSTVSLEQIPSKYGHPTVVLFLILTLLCPAPIAQLLKQALLSKLSIIHSVQLQTVSTGQTLFSRKERGQHAKRNLRMFVTNLFRKISSAGLSLSPQISALNSICIIILSVKTLK